MRLAVQQISTWRIGKILKLWGEKTNHIGGIKIFKVVECDSHVGGMTKF